MGSKQMIFKVLIALPGESFQAEEQRGGIQAEPGNPPKLRRWNWNNFAVYFTTVKEKLGGKCYLQLYRIQLQLLIPHGGFFTKILLIQKQAFPKGINREGIIMTLVLCICVYILTYECVHRSKMKKYQYDHYCPLKLFHSSTSKNVVTFHIQEKLL